MPEINLDLSDVQESKGFGVMPSGDYHVAVEGSEAKNSQAGNQYLEFVLEIVSGEFTGRKLFTRMNIWHAKPDVAQRAMGDLKALSMACGHGPVIRDTEDLHGRTLIVKVGVEKDAQYGDKNKVLEYKAIGEVARPTNRTPPANRPVSPAPAAGPMRQAAPVAAQQPAKRQSPFGPRSTAPKAAPVSQDDYEGGYNPTQTDDEIPPF